MNDYEKRKPEEVPLDLKEFGFVKKYYIEKWNHVIDKRNPEHSYAYRTKVDNDAEYFVLRLDDGGGDSAHISACRQAILLYATLIQSHLPKLAEDIFKKYGV